MSDNSVDVYVCAEEPEWTRVAPELAARCIFVQDEVGALKTLRIPVPPDSALKWLVTRRAVSPVPKAFFVSYETSMCTNSPPRKSTSAMTQPADEISDDGDGSLRFVTTTLDIIRL